MSFRICLTFTTFVFICSIGRADTTIFDDNFDSYADDAALYEVWVPSNGSDDGILTSEALDPGLYPGTEGQGVDHIGGSVMEHIAVSPAAPVSPSASQSIVLKGDMFVNTSNNERLTISMRDKSTPEALIEMGIYNSNGQTDDPTDPDDDPTSAAVPVTAYAYRLILFDTIGGDLVQNPNWQFFQFDPSLDTTSPSGGEPDGVVNPADFGPGWHTYTATITETTITMELDIFRDGLDNAATNQAGSDVPGVDSSVTWIISSNANIYDSVRIGGPSGLSSTNPTAFDNISLTLVDDIATGDTDTEPDGDVDGIDFLALQRDNPSLISQWGDDYPTPLAAVSAVPEPGTMSLLLLASAGMLIRPRR